MTKRINWSLQKQSFLKKLFLSVLLMGLLPLLLASGLFYNTALKSLDQKIQIMNQMQLEQKANSLVIVFENILDLSKLLLLDGSFKEYSLLHHKEYFTRYREMADRLSPGERYQYLHYIELRAAMAERLELLPVLNDYLDSVHYFDVSSNTLFRSGSLPLPIQNIKEIDWYRNAVVRSAGAKTMSSRILLNTPYTEKNEITIVYRDILNDLCYFLNLNSEALYKNILSDQLQEEDSLYLALSDDEIPILADQSLNKKAMELIKRISLGMDFSRPKIKLGKKTYFINEADIQILNWRFYSFIDAEHFQKEYRLQGLMISVMIASLSLIILFMGYSYVKVIYKPFKTLFSRIKSDPKGFQEEECLNLQYIRNYIETVHAENDLLSDQLNAALPSYKNDFLTELLTVHEYSTREIGERFNLLKISLPQEHLRLLLILIDDNAYQNLNFKEQLYFRISIEKILHRHLSGGLPGELISLETHKYAYIFKRDVRDEEGVVPFAESVIQEIEKTLKCKANITLGEYCRSIYDLPRSYQEAEELLKYQLIFGKGVVIRMEDILPDGVHSPRDKHTLKDMIQRIDESIGKGEGRTAGRICKRFVLEIFNKENRLCDSEIQELKFELLECISSRMRSNDQGNPLDLRQKERILNLQKLDNREDLTAFYTDLIQEICGVSVTPVHNHMDTILKMLEEDYGDNMNLSILSDKMKLNPSYISRMFKEQTGVGFIEYLTDLRLNKASAMLLETTMSIQDICLKAGYWNTNYFIKVFKKKTGLTPGEYRKTGETPAKGTTISSYDQESCL